MLSKLLIAWCLTALCVGIHAMGLTTIFRWMSVRLPGEKSQFWLAIWLLIRVAGMTILLHLLQIAVWAFLFAWSGGIPDLTSAFYFSGVTYTTTGYGDIVLPEEWRLVGGVEALTGILMCGLSTGFFFAVFSIIFEVHAMSIAQRARSNQRAGQ